MAIFPRGPGLASTRMSPDWTVLKLRVTDVVVTTGAISRTKLQSKCHHTGRMPFLSPNQQCQSTEGRWSYYNMAQWKFGKYNYNLSLRFNGHFPGEPGLAGVYWSKGWRRWWWQLDTEAISRAKLQSNHHQQQTNTQFFLQPGCPSCRPINSVKALKGISIIIIVINIIIKWPNHPSL